MAITSVFQQTEMEPWLKEIIRSIVERSEFLRKEPYAEYKGQRTAPFTPDMQKAFELARITGDYEPFMRLAQQNAERGSEELPGNIDKYMNPYQKNVIDNLIHYSGRGFEENILPALESHFVGLGQHGSTKHQTMAQRAARDQQEALNRAIGEQLASGYETSGKLFNTDKARQLEAAKLYPEFGMAQQSGRLTDVSALGQAGAIQQGHEQKARDLAFEEFLRQQNYPLEALKQQAALVGGAPREQAIYQVQQGAGNSGEGEGGGGWSDIGKLAKQIAPGALARMEDEPAKPGWKYLHKKGGGIKGAMKMHSFAQSSFTKKPKIGGKTKLKKPFDIGRI